MQLQNKKKLIFVLIVLISSASLFFIINNRPKTIKYTKAKLVIELIKSSTDKSGV